MLLADRIELAERLCAARGYTVRMTVQPNHGQPRYSGPPRPYMADGRWALYAVHAATGRMVSLGDRSRPPTERRIARQLDRLDRLVAAARADDADLAAVPTSATEAWMQFLAGCSTDAPARSEEDLRDMIHRLGLAYRIEGAHVQPEGADPRAWGVAWEAMYETGWAWDATVPDEAVEQSFNRHRR